MLLTTCSLYILLAPQTIWGIHFPFGNFDDSSLSLKPQILEKSTLFSINQSPEINISSTHRTEEVSPIFTDENTPLSDDANSTLSSVNQSLSAASSASSVSSASSIHNTETLTAIFTNESHSQSSTQFTSASSAATDDGTLPSRMSSNLTTVSNNEGNASSSATDDDEPEGVARGKPSSTEGISTTTTRPPTLFERSWTLISDTYTLSILVPVAAGIVFASTIILTIATCRCLRRRCVRRRLRRKTLPDSVKNLRPSDRARLLAESSDEEF